MAQHNKLGSIGESLAENYLIKKGFQIIEKNWAFERCEIDIIAGNEDFIVFVEVKTRSTNNWENPEEAVDQKKIKRIVHAADHYLHTHKIEKPARFDVIAIVTNKKFTQIDHFEDAFFAPLN